jgi:ankyrin repeat protein
VDAVARTPSGALLLSFDVAVDLGGVRADDEDLVSFDGAAYALVFDGSAEGVDPGLDLDGAAYAGEGRYALSFDGPGSLGGVSFADEDVITLKPGVAGVQLFFDASAVHAGWTEADLDAVALPQTDVPLKQADLDAASRGIGTTALVFAIINTHYDLAAMLVDRGADPNIADSAGEAALYAAVDMNSLQWVQGRPAPILHDRLDGADLVKVLLAKGANPNARLKKAPLKRHHDAGSTMNFNEGTTPLMRASRTNDVAVMRTLLDAGADPFLTLPDGTTTLMIAAGQGYGGLRGEGIRIVVPTEAGAVEAVSLLLERGADVNAVSATGNTALHGAVARGDAVVTLLAQRGAALMRNNAGFSPLDLALGAGGRAGRAGTVRESTAALLRQLYPDASPSDPPAPRPRNALAAPGAQ